MVSSFSLCGWLKNSPLQLWLGPYSSPMFAAVSKTFSLKYLIIILCMVSKLMTPLCFLTLLATLALLPVMTLPGVRAQVSCSQVIVWWHCEGALAGHFTEGILCSPFSILFLYCLHWIFTKLYLFLGFLSIPTASSSPHPCRPVAAQWWPTCGDALSTCFEGLVCIVFYSKGRLAFRKFLSSCCLSTQGSIIALCCSLQQGPALRSAFSMLI